MKRLSYFVASAIFLIVSCQKSESPGDGMPETERYNRNLTAVVEVDPETRVGFDQDGAFYWQKGDNVGVQTSAGLKEMTLDEAYQGQPSGVFYGDFEESIGEYVVYPFGPHVFDGKLLTYVLPSSYTYPFSARRRAQKRPAGPIPTTIGRAPILSLPFFTSSSSISIALEGIRSNFASSHDVSPRHFAHTE